MNTINFLYFAHNFSTLQLDKIFLMLGSPSHFKSKFLGARGNDGAQKFLNWFMMLSLDDMLLVVNWVESNYKNL